MPKLKNFAKGEVITLYYKPNRNNPVQISHGDVVAMQMLDAAEARYHYLLEVHGLNMQEAEQVLAQLYLVDVLDDMIDRVIERSLNGDPGEGGGAGSEGDDNDNPTKPADKSTDKPNSHWYWRGNTIDVQDLTGFPNRKVVAINDPRGRLVTYALDTEATSLLMELNRLTAALNP